MADPEDINLGSRSIGLSQPVFIIAEAGINHNGDIRLAEKLIKAARQSGADAIKFQTYVTEKRVARESAIYGILKQCELSYEVQKKLFQIAQSEGILFFSTPFDLESADFLTDLGTPLMKIASFDIVNHKLLRHVAAKKIPIIASRGMANETEIDGAITIFESFQVPYALLHCVSSYPNKEENSNLSVIKSLYEKYRCVVGYSDHTLGIQASVLAVAVGAKIIEKHFTLDRNMPGPDHLISADSLTMSNMIQEIRKTENILGDGQICMVEAEKPTAVYRRVSI